LTDDWLFQRGDTWASWLIGQTIQQHAPGIVTRGPDLKAVTGTGLLPFVVASQHPNGALAVGTLPRSLTDEIATLPAAVTLSMPRVNVPVGVFGNFETLTLATTEQFSGKQVLAQDLASDVAVDVTQHVIINQNEMIIPGDLIRRLGTSANGPADQSDTGLVFLIQG
jgi:hypothetical protein